MKPYKKTIEVSERVYGEVIAIVGVELDGMVRVEAGWFKDLLRAGNYGYGEYNV